MRGAVIAVLPVLLVVGAGCEEGSSGTGPTATEPVSASPPASASAPASAPASASAPVPVPVPTPVLAPTPTPLPTPTASARFAIASDAGKPAPTCGDKPLPACPLYGWMKANTSPAMSGQDFDALAKALDRVVSFAPPGYGNWASISRDGANAARAQSLDGVKASCRGCHNQYKDRYKKEMRDRPI
jgi:hypothetical protein